MEGKFQNHDPKSITFFTFYVIFSTVGKIGYLNRNLDKIAVILVVDLVFYVQY